MAGPTFTGARFVRVAGYAPAAGANRVTPAAAPARASLLSGRARVHGVISRLNAPAPDSTVRLYLRRDGTFLREVKSGVGGAYSFEGLTDAHEVYVVALDDKPDLVADYDPVISSLVTPGAG